MKTVLVSSLAAQAPVPAPVADARLRQIAKGLKADGRRAFAILAWVAALSGVGLFLSLSPSLAVWASGQAVLGVSMLQWFVILHETGHNTFFPSRAANKAVGHVASLFALIPFHSWQAVHHQHHLWTGWRDIDPTMTGTVPRPLSALERRVMDACWRLWLPLFSVLYRATSYWHFPRLRKLFPSSVLRGRILRNMLGLALVYALTLVALGPALFAKLFLLSFFIQLVLADPILLSQHTHVPLRFARGAGVDRFSYENQDEFTRSLECPWWVARLVLFNFNLHSVHHLFPNVPGYLLHNLPLRPSLSFPVWRWIRAVKRVPAHVFIFKHREQTGLDV